MNQPPLPNFTAVVQTTAPERLPELSAALAEAQARVLARIAEEGTGRARKAQQTAPTKWGDTLKAARIAGLFEEGDSKKKIRIARMRIAQWAKGQAWASHPSGRKLLVDLDGFSRWLDVRRSA